MSRPGFDRRVHIRDPKTGRVVQVQPYTEHVIKGKHYLERPKGSGNIYWEDGSPAGRLEYEPNPEGRVVKRVYEGADHKEWVPAEVKQEIARQSALEKAQAKIAELEAKLIKGEAAPKVVAQVEAQSDVASEVVAPKVSASKPAVVKSQAKKPAKGD